MNESAITNFIFRVKKMRDAQKRYFRTRSSSALSEAKALEVRVDRDVEILGLELPHEPIQTSLF